MDKLEEFLEFGGLKKDIIFLILSAIGLLNSLFNFIELPFDMAWIAIILCGIPIILEAIIGLVTAFDIKADVLVSIALIASVITGEIFAAGEVAFIMQIGALLEDLTVSKAREGIEKLVHLTPTTARIIRDNKDSIINAKEVLVGDILRILPGETIPVDGVILSGRTSVNQAVMTGESMPVDKTVGDEVSSGTVNQFGSFDMKAVKVGEDSSIQRMIKLVQSADAGKAKIVGVADKWATWIVVIALTSALITWIITGEIIRAVTILVVFCPCALVLATPTAIMAAIGNSTKHSFLVREGDALERLSMINKITFDKTGTLTYGTPKVVKTESFLSYYSDEDIYRFTASAELRSEHPLGKAVVSSYKTFKTDEIKECESFEMVPGRGVLAIIEGHEIIAGNKELLNEKNIKLENINNDEKYISEGCTIIYTAIDGVIAGFIALADTVRNDVEKTISNIKEIGIEPVLLTGDNKNTAKNIADNVGISEFYSECLPEDKLNIIEKYQIEKNKVCMIGDGINDAPALKKAFVGIAMGGIGSDIAMDAADIVLVNDDIKEIPHILKLSKKMMTTIKYNLTFSMILNFVAIILAITGILNPVVGALVHNAGSVFVIINSAFLLKWRDKK